MRGVFYTLFSRFFEIIFGIVLLIVTARLFGAEGRGHYSAAIAATGVFGVLCSINLSRGVYSGICTAAGSVDDYVKRSFISILLLALLGSAFGLAAYAIGYSFGLRIFQAVPRSIAVTFAFYIPCLIWSGVANAIYSSVGLLSIKNNISVLSKFIFLCIVLSLYLLGHLTLLSFCAAFVVCSLGAAVTEILFLSKRYFDGAGPWRSMTSVLLKSSLVWYPDLVGGFMISGAVNAVVAYYLAPRSIGIFGVAMQVFTIGFSVVPSVLQLYVARHIATIGPVHAVKTIYRYALYYSAYFAVVYILLWGAGEYIGKLVLGDDFVEAVDLLRTLALAGWMNGIVLLLAPLWTAMRYVKFTTVSTLVLGCAGLGALVFLTAKYGLFGASLGMVAIYTTALACNLMMLLYTVRNVNAASSALT